MDLDVLVSVNGIRNKKKLLVLQKSFFRCPVHPALN